MCDLQLEIGRRFRGRVLRIHPLVLRILTAVVAVVESKWEFRADENAHPNECSFPASLRAPCYSPRLIRSQVCADKIRAECRQIENDHDEREEMHPHREADPDVHCTNANQPNLSRLAVPNEKWISDLQETNKDSRDWEQVPPSHEYLGINNVKGRPYQCPPYIRTIPPSASETLC